MQRLHCQPSETDLIHAAWWNCMLVKRPKESGNECHALSLKRIQATFMHNYLTFFVLQWLLLPHFLQRWQSHAICWKAVSHVILLLPVGRVFTPQMLWYMPPWRCKIHIWTQCWRHPASHTLVPLWFVTLLSQNTGKVLRARNKREREKCMWKYVWQGNIKTNCIRKAFVYGGHTV